MIAPQDTALDSVIHVIQTALTPIFFLTAIASLLGVFTSRLARIADQVDQLAHRDGSEEPDRNRRLAHLRRRSHALDLAVILGALAGGCTCATALTLFLGALRAKATAAILFVFFGLAICCTIGALGAFLAEMLMAGRGIRAEATRHQDMPHQDVRHQDLPTQGPVP